jgi:hypothetical protein
MNGFTEKTLVAVRGDVSGNPPRVAPGSARPGVQRVSSKHVDWVDDLFHRRSTRGDVPAERSAAIASSGPITGFEYTAYVYRQGRPPAAKVIIFGVPRFCL